MWHFTTTKHKKNILTRSLTNGGLHPHRYQSTASIEHCTRSVLGLGDPKHAMRNTSNQYGTVFNVIMLCTKWHWDFPVHSRFFSKIWYPASSSNNTKHICIWNINNKTGIWIQGCEIKRPINFFILPFFFKKLVWRPLLSIFHMFY